MTDKVQQLINLDIPAVHEDLSNMELDEFDFDTAYEQLEAEKIDLKEGLACGKKLY